MQCPPVFLPEPKISHPQLITSLRENHDDGSLLDLFQLWEERCESFWEKSDKLIFEEGALAGKENGLEDFFQNTARELYQLLIEMLHEKYQDHINPGTVISEEDMRLLDEFYMCLFDNLFHMKAQNNLDISKKLHQSMVMNGFPLSCGDAYFDWPDTEDDIKRHNEFLEDFLGLKVVENDDQNRSQ